jgi:hypothetical protein
MCANWSFHFGFLVFCLTCICIGDGNKMLSPWYELDCIYAKVASLHSGHAHGAHYGVLTCVLIYGVNFMFTY